jgi:hypothetical protein
VLVEPGFCPSFWFKNADMELPPHDQTKRAISAVFARGDLAGRRLDVVSP